VFSGGDYRLWLAEETADIEATAIMMNIETGWPKRTPRISNYIRHMQPLIDAGLAQPSEPDGSEVIEGFSFHPSPEGSVYQSIVVLRSEGAEAVFGGKLFLHPIQVSAPELASNHDVISNSAKARRTLVHTIAESNATFFSSRFTSSSRGRITKNGTEFSWKFV
jgi:hypothetical protein